MKRIIQVLCSIHFIIAIAAIFGGIVGMLNPYDPIGVPIDLLEGSPFSNYFIPSLILFTIIGLGHAFSGIMALKKSIYLGYISSVFFGALMIWIVVQCLIMGLVDIMHVVVFSLGFIGAALAVILLLKKGQFPFND